MRVLLLIILFFWTAAAQSLPAGPGRDVVDSVCSLCHDAASAILGKQWNRTQWELKITEMLQEEPDVTKEERAVILEYLVTHFQPGGKIYVNKALSDVLQTALDIPAQAAAAIVRHRERNGDFKTLEDLRKVQGLDASKIEAKKDLLVF
jgi:competence protein ComEA